MAPKDDRSLKETLTQLIHKALFITQLPEAHRPFDSFGLPILFRPLLAKVPHGSSFNGLLTLSVFPIGDHFLFPGPQGASEINTAQNGPRDFARPPGAASAACGLGHAAAGHGPGPKRVEKGRESLERGSLKVKMMGIYVFLFFGISLGFLGDFLGISWGCLRMLPLSWGEAAFRGPFCKCHFEPHGSGPVRGSWTAPVLPVGS